MRKILITKNSIKTKQFKSNLTILMLNSIDKQLEQKTNIIVNKETSRTKRNNNLESIYSKQPSYSTENA